MWSAYYPRQHQAASNVLYIISKGPIGRQPNFHMLKHIMLLYILLCHVKVEINIDRLIRSLKKTYPYKRHVPGGTSECSPHSYPPGTYPYKQHVPGGTSPVVRPWGARPRGHIAVSAHYIATPLGLIIEFCDRLILYNGNVLCLECWTVKYMYVFWSVFVLRTLCEVLECADMPHPSYIWYYRYSRWHNHGTIVLNTKATIAWMTYVEHNRLW